MVVSHNLTQTPDKFIIAGDNDEYNQTEMVSCVENYHGDYYFDNETTYLYYVGMFIGINTLRIIR